MTYRDELKKALEEGTLFDYTANEYHNFYKYELKEIILAILGVVYDNRKSEDDYLDFQKQVKEELKDRCFFLEDNEEE